jgi:hypothetical protein
MKNLRLFKKITCLRNRFVDGGLWFISTSRNAFAVIGGCVAAYVLEVNGLSPFTLTGFSAFPLNRHLLISVIRMYPLPPFTNHVENQSDTYR